MTFAEAEKYLSSLISYEKYGRAKYGQRSFSLTVFRHIMEKLGNPQKRLRAIHVAGTDGKGSICQYLTSILQQAGFTVGTYTSPHLVSVRERIEINRIAIDEDAFALMTEKVQPILDSIPASLPPETPEGECNPPSFFEAVTAMAFCFFAEQRVDYAVVEVGLGGRLDATNIISPIACILTPLDLEHTDLLGSDLESIAREKVGIAKPGVPFFVSRQVQGLETFIESLCLEKTAIPCMAGEIAEVEILERSLEGYTFQDNLRWTRSEAGSWRLRADAERTKKTILKTPLLGDHQVRNACLVVNALKWLEQQSLIPELSMNVIRDGLNQTRWQARIEVFRSAKERMPLVIVDCAHTVQASRTLRKTLDDLLPAQRKIFVLGYLHGKNIEWCLKELVRGEDRLFCVSPQSPRSLPSEELFNLASSAQTVKTKDAQSLENLPAILQQVESNAVVVIAGSVYLAGEARSLLLSLDYQPFH